MKVKLTKMYVDDEIRNKVIEVLNSGNYVKGQNLMLFEKEFAEFIGVKYAVGVNSGTSALFLSYLMLDLKPGDEVIVPSHTFIATVMPLLFFKAKPVFVDIDPETYCMNINDVKSNITNKTKAIVPVHMYGHSVDMDPLMKLAKVNNVKIIEDCCQAHGTTYKDKKVGSIGDVGCFSFFPSKVMTVCGDGGMITTNDIDLYEKFCKYRDQGRSTKYNSETIGLNFRMSEIHSAIGRVQLKHLCEWINTRRLIADLYNDIFKNRPIILPIENEFVRHSYYVYTIRIDNRDEFISYLKNNNIDTGIYYPIPVHRQQIIEKIYGIQSTLSITENIVDNIVSLPMSPLLNENELKKICKITCNFLEKK